MAHEKKIIMQYNSGIKSTGEAVAGSVKFSPLAPICYVMDKLTESVLNTAKQGDAYDDLYKETGVVFTGFLIIIEIFTSISGNSVINIRNYKVLDITHFDFSISFWVLILFLSFMLGRLSNFVFAIFESLLLYILFFIPKKFGTKYSWIGNIKNFFRKIGEHIVAADAVNIKQPWQSAGWRDNIINKLCKHFDVTPSTVNMGILFALSREFCTKHDKSVKLRYFRLEENLFKGIFINCYVIIFLFFARLSALEVVLLILISFVFLYWIGQVRKWFADTVFDNIYLILSKEIKTI